MGIETVVAVAAVAAAVVSAGVGAYSMSQQAAAQDAAGKQAKLNSNYQAQLAERNARIAENNREQSISQANATEAAQRLQANVVKNSFGSRLGASGVELTNLGEGTEDSPFLAESEFSRYAEADALLQGHQYRLAAANSADQSLMFMNESGVRQAEGKYQQGAAAYQAGQYRVGAFGTVLGGLGRAGSQAYDIYDRRKTPTAPNQPTDYYKASGGYYT